MRTDRLARFAFFLTVAGIHFASAPAGMLQEKEFSSPGLSIPTSNVDARTLMDALPRRAAWNRFFEKYGAQTAAFVDPSSGTLTNMIVSVPLIPGTGVGNRLGLKELARELGHPVGRIDASVVGDLVRDFVLKNRDVIGIDDAQLGSAIAAQVTDELWQVSIPQVVKGLSVRDGRIVATLSHGNLVLLGAEKWANVALDIQPDLTADDALAAAFESIGGRGCRDELWKEPALEIVPFATTSGFAHRLVWAFGLRRGNEPQRWELLMDAKDGEVLALRDTNLHESKQISGGVYPVTSTGSCPSSERCGTIQPDSPMPFTDTGLPPPNDYTTSAGVYDFSPFDSVTTTLNGRYVKVVDGCGALLETSEAGNLDLGGYTGQHECDSTTSPGNTAPTRTAFYELNKIIEQARGWLPLTPWLNHQFTVYVNQGGAGFGCGAIYVPSEGAAYFADGVPGACRNAAEIASNITHEWGHGLDYHDAIGLPSNSSEGYANIAAGLRNQISCPDYGFRLSDEGCGLASDGVGFNNNESRVQGVFHCDLDCAGGFDQDWDRHADHTPDTPQNFTCTACGGEIHCVARPVMQAVWDFAARDLQAPPFGLSRTDAFVVASKIFYQGSGNIGDWQAWSCLAGTANGCGAANAYMQWLAADDDNGNLSDGTPHMTALHAAFDRHNAACNTPVPQNGGCAGGPLAAPTLVATPGSNRVDLSWSAVAGATRYRVLRTEGHAGCDMGKAVIAETTALSYADTGLANGRTYYYVVHAVRGSASCFGPSGPCQSATPVQCAGSVSLPRNRFRCNDSLDITLEDQDLHGAGAHTVSVVSNSEATPETVSLTESPAGSGRFTGTLAITAAPPAGGDGAISVVHGDTITIGYVDASRCGTPGVLVERSALTDCRGPVITNVRVADISGTRAVVLWDTEEPSDSRVVYGPTVPPNLTTPPDAALVTSHSVPLQGLAECTDQFFSVRSSDRLGNESSENNAGGFFAFETTAETTPIFTFPGLPLPIPSDNPFQGLLATIHVPDVDLVQDVNVKVSIVHPEDDRLALSLIGPDHTTVILSSRHGADGEDYDDTVFDDEATRDIADGAPPFAGSFRPEQPLSAFNGKIATGDWTLQVTDDGGFLGDGTLAKFEMALVYPHRDCGPFVELASPIFSDACIGSGSGGGNGIVDPGETVQVVVRVVNGDTVSATGLSARLSSFTPGVFVTGAASTYPDLAPGVSAPGDVPYALYLDPGVPCGTAIVLRLEGISNEGDWFSVFSIDAGEPDPVTTAYFNNTQKPIPDLSTVRSFISVTDPGVVQDVDVGLSIAHGSVNDLDISLVGPDNTRVELSTDNGGGFGSNYTDTVFDDEAAVPVTAGSAPFTGSFRPESPLSALDGTLAYGTWTLEVTDDHQSVPGTLLRWSLSLERLADNVCVTCPVAESPTEVLSLAWSGSGKDTLAWSATPRATTYTLHRGLAADLPALLDGSVDSCERLASSQLTSGPVLTETPASGTFFWFLVRAQNAFGAGSTGSATTGTRALNAGGACP